MPVIETPPLARAAKSVKKSKVPVWKGPEEDGITFSLLSKFLVCRERFRLLVVDGLQAAEKFNHRIEYGNMWHVCEEALAGTEKVIVPASSTLPWESALTSYCRSLCAKYPMQREEIDKWYRVCLLQFPLYVDHWAKHPDVTARTPLLQECSFSVPHVLRSGRTVRLRGKFDSVDLVGKGRQAAIYLQENKSKGDPDEQQIKRQLTFDLQTMMYVVALLESDFDFKASVKSPVGGVRYNVVRRPLSGGKGTIKRREPSKSNPAGESEDEYWDRVASYIRESPQDYFMRWRVEIAPEDVERFKRECLDPILEQLCDWWQVVTNDSKCKHWAGPSCLHFRMPFGVYSGLMDARVGVTDLDEHLATGSTVGLRRVKNLFPELP
jgi:hypothetical protein